MNSTEQFIPNQSYSTPARRTRRKIAREVGAAYDALLRAAGFGPGERRTAWAIDCQLYELDSQAPETPRRIPLSAIGAALTSASDDAEARARTASRNVGQLFNHAMPRTGYQIQTRYKSPEESGTPHEYSSHAILVAELLAELHAEKRAKILADRSIERRRQAIEDALERLAAEALALLPRCEVELIDPDGNSYAYVSAPEAKAYCKTHGEFSARRFDYTPPEDNKKPKRPFTGADWERIEDRAVKMVFDDILGAALDRNGFDGTALFLRTRLWPKLQKTYESWFKVEGNREPWGTEEKGDEEENRINTIPDLSGVPAQKPVEIEDEPEGVPPDNVSGVPFDNSAKINDLQNGVFETCKNPVVASENFDTSLEAAIFYAKDGWNVLPICQWDSNKSRCTHAKHATDCGGRKPLIAREGGKPGDGYAGSTDLDQIRDWWRKHPDAGVAIRLDGHVLVDCDLKDGGPDSYRFLRDTFDLPPTLTAITQSGGNHYVFKIPKDLPGDWLKSWTRVTDKVALGGIDLKVDKCGLLFAEPTRGSKGVYRWIDPTVEPAELPRACADFLHGARYKDAEQRAGKERKTRVYSNFDAPREFDPDQEKYFRDVPAGERHKRLFSIAVVISRQTGAGVERIKKALNYHAAAFSTPLDDPAWIDRVAATIGGGQ
jgi:hypothetical protein